MRKADNLPPSCAVVTEFGNLNFLEPSGPVQACHGTALPKDVEKIKTHILCSITFFFKTVSFWDNVGERCRAKQVTDENMAHAYCMLGTLGYKYKLRICNTYYLFTATMVAWALLNMTLYTHCFMGLYSCNKRSLEFATCLLLSSFQSYETHNVTVQWILQYISHLPLSLLNTLHVDTVRESVLFV